VLRLLQTDLLIPFGERDLDPLGDRLLAFIRKLNHECELLGLEGREMTREYRRWHLRVARHAELLGVDERCAPKPVPLFANPDFHDGQVPIDRARGTITILDFGQSLPITNQEREHAIDLLRVVSRTFVSDDRAAELLNHAFAHTQPVTALELEPLLARPDRMDRFIRLLSLPYERGHDVPLSVVHWVLGVNRQLVLAEKAHLATGPKIRNLLLGHAAGLSLEEHNRVRRWLRRVGVR
jgi:hypothetical protein